MCYGQKSTRALLQCQLVGCHSRQNSGHCELQATSRMLLWAPAIPLSKGKNIRLFSLLDQKRCNSTLTCYGGGGGGGVKRGSHRHNERLAWVTSRGQGTACSISFVSKSLKRTTRELTTSFLASLYRKVKLSNTVMHMCVANVTHLWTLDLHYIMPLL